MPYELNLYEAVEKTILEIANSKIEVKKTQISFGINKKFAWVWLPIRKIKNRPEKYIVLTFALSYQIRSPRIIEAVEPYPNRWTHHVIIEKVSDIDNEIKDWLKEASEFSKRS